MSRPFVFVIVLNWNRREDTLECLRSLEDLTYLNYEVMVVDNDSSDDSVSAIRESFPDVKLIVNADNLGYAEGNNVGMRYALSENADYVFLLNNDTTVAPDMLSALVNSAEEDSSIGVIGPKIYYTRSENLVFVEEGSQPPRLWYAGAKEQWLRRIPASVGLDELDRGQYDQKQETAFVYGTAMLIRRQVLEAIGGFDDRFFAYHEDADFCLRARAAGYYCVYDPSGVVWHKVSQATSGASYIQDYLRARGRILFFFKHLQGGRLYLVLVYEVYRWLKVCIPYVWRSQLYNAVAYSQGLWDGICEFGLHILRLQRYPVRLRIHKLRQKYGSDKA